MNILIPINDAYYDAAKIMLRSLFCNNTDCNIVIYLFYAKIEKKKLLELRTFIHKNHSVLYAIKINDDILENVPVGAFAKETYFRLVAPFLLPKDLDRVLYLDTDMIITGSIREIYDLKFNNNLLMAVPDTSLGIENVKKNLHMKNSDVYVSVGTLLMNLELLREEFDLEKMLGYAVSHPDKVPNCDQDLINKFYHDRIGHIDYIYNYETRFHSILDLFVYFIQRKRLLKEVRIIHYMGHKKPWKPDYDGKFLREYYRYSKHTSYEKDIRDNISKRFTNIIKLIGTMNIKWVKRKIMGDV